MKLKWDHGKDWVGIGGKYLEVRIGDEKKHGGSGSRRLMRHRDV